MNTDGTDYNAYADYGAYQTEIAKDAPVIEYYGSGSLAPGTVNVADYVKHMTITDRSLRLNF